MADLSTYALTDFFPFTPEVYFRLFERLNEAVWPWQFLMVIGGAAAVALVWRGRSKPTALLLAAGWALVGYAFFLDLYAELNWAAEYVGWAFIGQALLIAIVGLLGHLDADLDEGLDGPGRVGLGLAGFGVLLSPLIGPLTGRNWAGVELFGVAPDPTVIATLGVALMARRVPWVLLVVPVVWAAMSAATALAMQAPAGFVTAAAALVALGAAVWKTL
jgi:hypothetical protein